jgi:protein-tyrosine phosphatase
MAFDEAGYPLNPYDEVSPGLFQASTDRSPQELFEEGFDAMFDLCGLDRTKTVPGKLYTFFEIDDLPWFSHGDAFDQMSQEAATLLQDGKRVVAGCMSGLNRSGLLVARTMIELGAPAVTAIESVRAARGPHALSNRHFVRWLLLDCSPSKIAVRRRGA